MRSRNVFELRATELNTSLRRVFSIEDISWLQEKLTLEILSSNRLVLTMNPRFELK